MGDDFQSNSPQADEESLHEEQLSEDELDNLLQLAREAMEHPEHLTIHQVQEMACGIIVVLRAMDIRPVLLS